MKFQVISLCIILLILSPISTKKNLKEVLKAKANDHKTVVQSNHFYSNYQTSTNYDINEVEKGKPLIFLLKEKDGSTDKQIENNHITITLTSGSDKQQCKFSSYYNMCSLKNITNSAMKLGIKCEKTPCELSWIILQPALVEDDGDHDIQKLVEVNDDNKHALVSVVCNNPDLKTFGNDLMLYTNSIYVKKVVNNQILFVFSNNQKGYYYFTSRNDAAKSCAKIHIAHAFSTIEFNKENNIYRDFINVNEINTYSINQIPTTDFRVELNAHDPDGKELPLDSGLKMVLIGTDDKNNMTVLQEISILIDDQKSFMDFSMIFKKPDSKYKKLQLSISAIKQLIIINLDFKSSEVQEVEMGEQSYFQLKKGEKIKYRLISEPEETSDDAKVYIFSSEDKKFKINQTSCSLKKGCEFTLEALQDGKGSIYLGQKEVKNLKEVVYFDFDKTFTKKLKDGDIVYLKKKIKAKNAFQVVVNTDNVIIYAASKQKCPEKLDQCHQKMLNSHNPIIYEPVSDGQLLFQVQGLDNTQFTLTVIDQNSEFVELKDSVPFTYLMDDQQSSFEFIYKINAKGKTSFNLIAPINQLNLIVINADKLKQDNTGAEISGDGYISFEKSDIKGLTFIIKIEKRQQFKDKYVHFTMIASSKNGNMRLEPGVAHYETIESKNTRDLVFEFEKNKEIVLNFYSHNVKKNVNIGLKISNVDEYSKSENYLEAVIDQQADSYNIKEAVKELCKKAEGENCELFVRLQNLMDDEVDIAITLLIKDSIIELKDGIWQNYNLNLIASTSHFYFQPQFQNKSVTILYHSSFVDMKLMYRLWKSDDKSISPEEWPFPDQYKEGNVSLLDFTPTHFVHIDAETLKSCWPNCIVLLSVVPDIKKFDSKLKQFIDINEQYKIMASNNFIEIPQKHKVDIVLKKKEQKILLVDLKYFLNKEVLTFFEYVSIGHNTIIGNVYSQKNPRCPQPEDTGDFILSGIETQISISDIQSKIKDNQIDNDNDIYICFLAQAQEDTKFSIQFSSDTDIMKTLSLDTFHKQQLASGETKIYQVDATQQFYLKVSREQGFPYITTKVCKQGDELENCLEKFKDENGKQGQLVDKIIEITEKPCEKCIIFIKVFAEEQSKITIHCQSKYTETELIENQMIIDQLDVDSQNRYLVTGTKQEQLIINIQIIQGDLKVDVHDFHDISISKSNTAGSKNIHIMIPVKNGKTSLSDTNMDAFSLSTFTSLHITVESQDHKIGAVYSITYSSGQPLLYLQDGLITQYLVVPKTPTYFIYDNPVTTSIYLHLSTPELTTLNKVEVTIQGILDLQDMDSATNMIPEKPSFKKKTPNPTLIMTLPPNKKYIIKVINNNQKSQLLTIGVNNRQIIYLPFDHQFPLPLAPSEYVYLVVNVVASGFVRLTFSKCDESKPFIGYTLDYDEFIKEEFSLEEQMPDDMITDLVVKVKKPGNIYIKIRSSNEDKSLLTVKSTFSATKFKSQRPKAGEKGLIQYQLLDSTKAQLTFTGLVCSPTDKSCNKDFSYSTLASDKIENVYAQLVCPSIAFDLAETQILKSAELTSIPTSNTKNSKITFTQPLKGQIEYVGVKAINSKTGEVVYYRPIEIATFMGQLHRGYHKKLILSIFIIIGLCISLIAWRKYKKGQSYQPLESQ